MKISLVALVMAFALSLGVATARADQTNEPQTNASQPAQSTRLNAANADTASAASSTGIYDEEDQYVDAQGWPLPGWESIGGWNKGH